MQIKNIFNVVNFKGLEDNFRTELFDTTYIIGDNAKRKTTIGSIPLWILTGYNLYGNNREVVSDDKRKNIRNTMASMTLIDNKGSEYVITRIKGKDNCVMIDGIRTSQEMLARFYIDVHAFLCSYNPRYFSSLDPAKQKAFLLKILPTISEQEAFNLLDKEEQDILENPVLDVLGYCKTKRQEIKQLEAQLNINAGKKEELTEIAIQKEDSLITFEKQSELDIVENQYSNLMTSSKDIVNLEDLQNKLKKLDTRINKNIHEDLVELKNKQEKELEKLKNINETSICPTCKNEIKNENLVKALTISSKKIINNLIDKIESLRKDTQDLLSERKGLIEQINIANTKEAKTLEKRKNELKEKMDLLKKEQNEIALKNQEISMKHNQIKDAKLKIEIIDKASDEISDNIFKNLKQIEIATKLNLRIIDKQMKEAKKYLNKVTIQFYEVDEDTGEMMDSYKIKYDGREYSKLSNSYKLRADIEISNLISNVTKINSMIFIDDAESITDINIKSNLQIIASIVVKYNELEILNNYEDVLKRKKDSVNKQIEESSKLLLSAA